MTDPTYDDERTLRTALGALLTDEPPTFSTVSDDVARGRALRSRRRARVGGGVALVAVVALVVGVVGPLRSLDRSTPAPLGSAAPSPGITGPQVAVADYLASQGWPVTSTTVTINTDDASISSATYAVHSSTTAGMTARLIVRSYDTAPALASSTAATDGFRLGSALQRCGAACGFATLLQGSCVSAAAECKDAEVYAWVQKSTGPFSMGDLILERRWTDGTQLEAVVSTRSCSSCAPTPTPSGVDPLIGTIPSFLPVSDARQVLELTGKPALRDQPAPSQSTFIADPSPNPYYTAHNVDPLWVKDSLAALTTYTTGQGALGVGEDDRTARLDVLRGDERAWLQLAFATTTPDAPECLGLPHCTVVRPWAPARGGSVEVAVTETTVPPNTSSTALRGPSYRVLVRSGSNLLRLDEGTTFPTLLNGQRPGYVLSWRQVATAADLLTVPGATSAPSGSPS